MRRARASEAAAPSCADFSPVFWPAGSRLAAPFFSVGGRCGGLEGIGGLDGWSRRKVVVQVFSNLRHSPTRFRPRRPPPPPLRAPSMASPQLRRRRSRRTPLPPHARQLFRRHGPAAAAVRSAQSTPAAPSTSHRRCLPESAQRRSAAAPSRSCHDATVVAARGGPGAAQSTTNAGLDCSEPQLRHHCRTPPPPHSSPAPSAPRRVVPCRSKPWMFAWSAASSAFVDVGLIAAPCSLVLFWSSYSPVVSAKKWSTR